MKGKSLMARLLSVILALMMVIGASPMAYAAEAAGSDSDALTAENLSLEKVEGVKADLRLDIDDEDLLEDLMEPEHADTDVVRVSIFLKDKATLDKFSTKNIADNAAAMAYREELQSKQLNVTKSIERYVLGGRTLDVVWNLTLAANVISANVQYGYIDEIEKVKGVESVIIEEQYDTMIASNNGVDPLMATSSDMIGSGNAWASGYTGAGTRIAVIDTGLDIDHQSFDSGAFLYSLGKNAEAKGMSAEEYIASLDLLDKAEAAEKLANLNIYPYIEYVAGTANGSYYANEKVPFAINYVDRDFDYTHDNDVQGGHGSHVAGIAAANSYIPDGKGGYANALETAKTQGVAPDAQLIIMKVFGKTGGAYDSDYIVAIEDAILLGCDVVNLSLGGDKGFSRSANYQHILDKLSASDTVVAIAAGNSGYFAGENSATGIPYLYAEDVDFSMVAQPATATDSLSVASVENTGATNYYIKSGEDIIFYDAGTSSDVPTKSLTTLAGNVNYIVSAGIGTKEEIAAIVANEGTIAENTIFVCARGEIAFAEKAVNSVEGGFAATIVYNNTDGIFYMNLAGYGYENPCVSISMLDGIKLANNAEAVTDAEGNVLYYKGTLYISDTVESFVGHGNYVMSDFSSWGVPTSLEMKPEITAPGGNIYSVNGEDPSGKAYMNNSGTSMASPQIAGMAALVMQYVRENGLDEKTGLTARQLATSLLMGTAAPITNNERYAPVLQQGSGLANVGAAINAGAYIKMAEGATSGASDGKVKVELGDDPERTGSYSFSFSVNSISDETVLYSLRSDFFTQGAFMYDGSIFADTETSAINAAVSYDVEGGYVNASEDFDCDLNGDNLTDEKDAQVILDYASGKVSEIAEKADVSADGKITTYDAHLLLASIGSGYFVVAPGESVDVTVNVALTDDTKEFLDMAFENGTYVQGFVYVEPLVTEDGAQEPAHSIPVLGFYGNWSDASMYDHLRYEDYVYYQYGLGDIKFPYSGGLHYLTFWDSHNNESYYVGNPYVIEETFPAHKAAISPDTEFGDMVVTLIRNAGGFMFYVDDGEGNTVVAESAPQLQSAFYYVNGQTWVNVNNVGLSIWATPGQLGGFVDGDEVTLGFMSVPEYYEKDGALTTEDMLELKNSGKIGEGAYHEYKFTVDGTAPEATDVKKTEDGDLIITAKDNQYIAAVAVLSATGGTMLNITGVEQDAPGTEVTAVLDMEGVTVNRNCLIAVCDYAGNESYYQFKYNDGIDDFDGKMYAFTNTATRGTINSWMEVNPDTLYYRAGELDTSGSMEVTMGGTNDMAVMDCEVRAAEYVNGHVFMITTDNRLVVANQGEWDYYNLATENRNYAKIRDLAYNTADEKLYALGRDNVVYTLDVYTGALEKAFTVDLAFPKTVDIASEELLAFAIDDEGNFYAVNNGKTNYKSVYLFKWSAEDIVDGKVSALSPVNNTADGYLGEYVYNSDIGTNGIETTQSMAWDHDKDVLYYAAAIINVSPYNILYTIDVETGKATATGSGVTEPGVADYQKGMLCANVAGLYIVPSEKGTLEETEIAQEIFISNDAVTLLIGAEYGLSCEVTPWNLTNKSVTWSTSDENIATVSETGVVTAVGEGIAYITATTVAEPHLTKNCKVTVEEIKDIELSGLAWNEDSKPEWIDFNTNDAENWEGVYVEEDYNFLAGGFLEDTIYTHDGEHMYGVNADTFEVTDYGYVDPTWQWSDAAPAPRNADGHFGRIVGIINNGRAIGVMNIPTGMGYEITHYALTNKVPMAFIALAGEVSHTDDYGTYHAYEYYILMEDGKLYKDIIWGVTDTDAEALLYDYETTYVGDTGLRLTGAGSPTGERAGSMYYDAENNYLVVAAYQGGEEANLYVFQPETCAPVKIGTFGNDVWPVSALYSYNRISELTVKLNTYEETVYAGDEVELKASVYPESYSKLVKWSSSDDSVATVDGNGVATAVAEGTATITATSVATNDNGEHATAEAVITVKPLYAIDEMFHAYIETEEGGKWVAIDGNDMTVTVTGESDASYTGAGVSEGKIYATDNKYYYEINPKNDYATVQGDNFTDAEGAKCLYMLDATSAPAITYDFTDLSTGEIVEDVELGGYPVYMSGYDGNGYHYLTLLENFETGSFDLAPIEYTYNPAAIAYHYSEEIAGYWFDFYYVLGYDGLLEHYSIYSGVANGRIMLAGGWENDNINTGLTFDDGEDVSMVYISNDNFTGIVVSNVTENGAEFYSYDLENRQLEKMGTIEEATDLVGLSLLSDVGVELPEEPEGSYETKLYGYVNTAEGYLWAEIDSETLEYTALTEAGTTKYTGGTEFNGKIYVSDETNYYEIDPEDGYSATKGAAVNYSYPINDATTTPVADVTIAGLDFTVGGYIPYICGEDLGGFKISYMMKLFDYTTTNNMKAKDMYYDGVAVAIEFLNAETNPDDGNYYEYFLVIDDLGKLYKASTKWRVYKEELTTSDNMEPVADLGIDTSKGASMTRVSEDEMMITVNGDSGVKVYSYVISTGALTEVGVIEGATSLAALHLVEAGSGEEPEQPVVPDDPDPDVPSDPSAEKLFGYVETADGYLWAEIDSENLDYKELTDASTTQYYGAAEYEGKVYAITGVNKYGNVTYTYAQIDPANGFAATAGAPASGSGTYNPAGIAATSDGRYFLQVSDGKYSSTSPKLYAVTDWKNNNNAVDIYVSSKTFENKLAGVAFLKTEAGSDGTYDDYFLLVTQDGKLYNANITTNGSTYSASVSAAGELGFNVVKGVSITAASEDEVYVTANSADGVTFYKYTISTGAVEELGYIEDFGSLIGLYMAPAAAEASLAYAGTEIALEVPSEAPVSETEEVNGSTMSVVISGEGNGTDGYEPGQVAYKDGKVVMYLSDTETATNGKFVLTFDPSVLTFESIASGAAYYSANTSDAENGKIVFAFASASAIPAGNILASVTFTSSVEKIDSDVTVETVERGSEVITDEKDVINVNNKSRDNKLKSLTVENAVLTPEFDPNVTEYNVLAAEAVKKLSIIAEANDSNATVEIDNPELVPGATTVVTITVTAENGDVRVYKINAYRPGVVFGDVNDDGKVNIVDAYLVRRYTAKLDTFTGRQLYAGDVNGDGEVNVMDANLIRRYAAKFISVFPVEEA
ncbi:MAG: S8 family serine peptidase [Oscillospiraceae bacterium]|nr:S8 family serine peptidase [Oscillospiraceae bacterium]